MEPLVPYAGDVRGTVLARFRHRSLSARFAAASALVLFVGAALLGTWVTRQIEDNVLHRAAANSAMYVEALVGPAIRGANVSQQWGPEGRRLAEAFAELTSTRRVVSIKIWSPDAEILYATDPGLIGKTFESRGLRTALRGEVVSERSDLDEDENVYDRVYGTELIETYIPIRDEPSGQIIAVTEFYQPTGLLDVDLAQARLQTWALIAAATLGMYLLLYKIVRSGSDTIERQRQQLGDAVDELSLAMHRLREASAARAETDEASLRRVARELHDGLAQDLAAALITMNDGGSGSGMTRAALESALTEVRALAAGLAAPDVAPLALGEVVEQACAEHERKTGQPVERAVSGLSDDVSEPVKIAVYRVLQEALSNAFRHAGPAPVRVEADVRDGTLRLACLDDGPGIHMNGTKGLGLRSMRERVELLDGSLTVAARGSRGTAVRAAIPLVREPEAVR